MQPFSSWPLTWVGVIFLCSNMRTNGHMAWVHFFATPGPAHSWEPYNKKQKMELGQRASTHKAPRTAQSQDEEAEWWPEGDFTAKQEVISINEGATSACEKEVDGYSPQVCLHCDHVTSSTPPNPAPELDRRVAWTVLCRCDDRSRWSTPSNHSPERQTKFSYFVCRAGEQQHSTPRYSDEALVSDNQ